MHFMHIIASLIREVFVKSTPFACMQNSNNMHCSVSSDLFTTALQISINFGPNSAVCNCLTRACMFFVFWDFCGFGCTRDRA